MGANTFTACRIFITVTIIESVLCALFVLQTPTSRGSDQLPSWAMQPPLLREPLLPQGDICDEVSQEPLSSVSERMEESISFPYPPPPRPDLFFCYEDKLKRGKKLPPWLEVLRAQDLEVKLRRLRDSLSRSYLVNNQPEDVLRALEVACDGDPVKMSGVAELCVPLIESMEMDRDTIIAAIFHYNSCLTVREKMLDYYMSLALSSRSNSESSDLSTVEKHPSYRILDIDESTYLLPLAGSGIEQFGDNVVKVALNAAKIKRTEVVSRKSVKNYREDAHNLRSLLLSVTGDWRSLAIRANASLFRMRGLLRARSTSRMNASLKETFKGSPNHSPLTKDEIREGKEALYVYAPLAHRLGMHRLKSELEAAAFELIYRRQHHAVWNLYLRDGWSGLSRGRFVKKFGPKPTVSKIPTSLAYDSIQNDFIDSASGSIGEGMQNVLNEVTKRVKRRLREDDKFMNSISSVVVTARIKEPFSLWKKLLKLRAKRVKSREALQGCTNNYARLDNSKGCNVELDDNKEWSVFDVPDSCALRVVLKSRPMSPNEDVEVTRARDRSLCYYVLDLCEQRWPATDNLRSKDYIKNPKDNGYQSLHYSTSMRWHGEDWPFEIQVRSRDMHRIAEYGFAAHWSYKIGENDVHTERRKQYRDGYIEATRISSPDNFVSFSPVNTLTSSDESTFKNYFESRNRVERALAQKERLEPYLNALSEARMDLNLENIFVFLLPENSTLKGGVLSLPVGACVLDALREALNRFGDDSEWRQHLERRDVKLLCNGEATTLTRRLRTGDLLTVPSVEEDQKAKLDISPMHV